jgi:hypothetical protein
MNAIRLVGDEGVTLDVTPIAVSPTGFKVRIGDDVPSWVPRTHVLACMNGKLVVTSLFAKWEGLL